MDLLKRKITKEYILKNQKELNTRQLLEKFCLIQSNSNQNEIDNPNKISSNNNNSHNFKEEIFNTLKNDNNNINKYEEIREIYKKERDKKNLRFLKEKIY